MDLCTKNDLQMKKLQLWDTKLHCDILSYICEILSHNYEKQKLHLGDMKLQLWDLKLQFRYKL